VAEQASVALFRAEVEAARTHAVGSHAERWARAIAAWREDAQTNRAWLLFATSLLCRTGGTRWAVDPFLLPERIGQKPDYAAAAADLTPLDVVFLTHGHADHFSPQLLTALAHHNIAWVVPDHLHERLLSETSIPPNRIRVARAGEALEFLGIRATPFTGAHVSVPATGYLIEAAGKRLLFPGDTRSYDTSLQPCLDAVDVLFANLWLGRATALQEHPPLTDALVRFCLAHQPARIVLMHLHEVGRSPDDYWTPRHAQLVADAIAREAPRLPVTVPDTGDPIELG
jgi:L-ascorbate metabolism protein UlaG (beta-lactamase superfamily)